MLQIVFLALFVFNMAVTVVFFFDSDKLGDRVFWFFLFIAMCVLTLNVLIKAAEQ